MASDAGERRRVVVTGVGLTCPMGRDVDATMAALRAGESAIRYMSEWDAVRDLKGRLGAVVTDTDLEEGVPAERRARMGRVARRAARATSEAGAQARLDRGSSRSDRTGIAYGSTSSTR